MANTRKPVKPKAGAKPADVNVFVPTAKEVAVAALQVVREREMQDADDEAEIGDEVSYTPTAEEIAAVLAFIKSQTVAETLLEEPAPVAKELFVRVYDVVDTITGTSTRPEDNGALTLSGRVTDADLDAAGVDKAWLLRIGAIVDAGYTSV